jgi:hypothetical protein
MRMSQPERRLSLILLQRCLAGARLTPAGERVVALLPWARHLLKHRHGISTRYEPPTGLLQDAVGDLRATRTTQARDLIR